MKPELIAVGASAGGVQAFEKILSGLKPDFEVPLVFLIHLPAQSRIDFQTVFARVISRRVHEVEDKMPIEREHIYFAPPAYHTQIEKEGYFSLSMDSPVQYSRPSIDVLFESMAVAFGEKSVGVLLTGANEDGARGLRHIQESGGLTIVQDPETAEMPTMPTAALRMMEPTYVAPLSEIVQILNRFSSSQRKETEI